MVVGDVPAVPRLARRQPVRARHRHAGAARRGSWLRDGRRGGRDEPATDDDIAEMAASVAEGLRPERSASRRVARRCIIESGELVRRTMVDADELYGIADAMAGVGHGVFEFAPEHAILPDREWP